MVDHVENIAWSECTSEAVVSIAKNWLGTPYRHQCTVMGSGTDCLGLIRGVWRTLYGAEPLTTPPYTMDWSEPSRDEVLMRAADLFLTRIPNKKIQKGDVLLFRMLDHSVAKHLGIVSTTGQNPKFIHAYTGHGVVESSLSSPWERRIAAVFRFPEKAF